MSAVEISERICSDLTIKRNQLVDHGAVLDEERRRIAFSAHTGDQAAGKRLDAINEETAKHASELASLDAAITEAANRLENAKREEAAEADRVNALALRAALADFSSTGKELAAALTTVVAKSNQLAELVSSVNALGAANPSSRQFLVVGRIALLSSLRETPWARDFDPVPPLERRDFATLISGWCAMVERDICRRLGDREEEAAA